MQKGQGQSTDKFIVDTTSLLISLLFGCVGMFFFMYGKNAGQYVYLGSGVALMVFPYFIPNMIAMLIVCGLLSAVPFVVRTD